MRRMWLGLEIVIFPIGEILESLKLKVSDENYFTMILRKLNKRIKTHLVQPYSMNGDIFQKSFRRNKKEDDNLKNLIYR